MDGYAPAYVAHNIPLLVVSGLGFVPPDELTLNEVGTRVGTRVISDLPIIDSADSQVLLRHFRDNDAGGLPWNSREYTGRNKFRVKTVGRDYVLPPKHAVASSPRPPFSQDSRPTPRTFHHSPLSPLTPGSLVFPDGLIDPKWIEKHQELVPSAYLSFYKLTSDPTLSTLHDNRLKTDINNTKNILTQSGYKSRLVVGLLSEESLVHSEVEDRLANIRKATGLDSKSSLFWLPPKSSALELQAFVETIISTIYPQCIEYYRDLSKHSRRKRNRGMVPPPTAPPTSGTSQTLSSQGWNVRYDFKLGVFAEFRQEMDAAVKSYESGYETLLSPDVLEATSTWSPRWNEGRLLADVFAIRILRCLFWNGYTTAATRQWQQHRDRMRDFVDRRGKGSATYGWKAWEARWATVMAEMIKKVSIVEFTGTNTFLPPEKAFAVGERMEPWEYLHHPGYWYRLAAQHLIARRALALEIPDEYRSPPGSYSASQTASKAYTYDTYLCPEPHEESPLHGRDGIDHSFLIINTLTKAINEFEQRKQSRLAQDLSLLSAQESLRRHASHDALRVLRPLWQNMSFRREGWWNIAEEVGWALREAAVRAGDGGTVIAVDWELMNRNFSHHQNWHYDLSKSLEGLENIKNKPIVLLHDEEVHSFLSATYSFEYSEGKVGEICLSQLAVTSTALPISVPVTMTEIKIDFDGSMKLISLKHDSTAQKPSSRPSTVSKVYLADVQADISNGRSGRPMLSGTSDLTFRPGQRRVFEFSSLLREAGEARALKAAFAIASDPFELEFIQTFRERSITPEVWWGENSSKKKLARVNASSITVLPKPPKMELRFVGLQEQYYTNESIRIVLEVINGEDADSIANLKIHLVGESVPSLVLKLAGSDKVPENSKEGGSQSEFALGNIAVAASCTVELFIPPIDLPAVYDLTMKTSYNLVSDLETPVSRSMCTQLVIINPFEANYDFSARIHHDPWPSVFTHGEGEDPSDQVVPHGLAQKWRLTSRYFSFAAEDLIVEDLNVDVLGTNGGIYCFTRKVTSIPEAGIRVSPKSLDEAEFDVFTHKLSLDDRGTAILDVSLAIRWRRDEEGSPVNATVLAVPRLLVSSSEPRVLGAVSYSGTIPSMIHFDVTIENPSNHFLTFGVSMEPSEKFAFSGVKQSTLQLVPLSRHTIRFRFLPFSHGEWIGPIRCVIKDRYFQKVLKIAPTEGMRLEKDAIYIWVPLEEEIEVT